MVAEIYLIKRLPRRISFFDYQIPAGTEVRRGTLVHAPFRNQVVRGIVAGTKSESKQKEIKELIEVIDPKFLSDTELAVYETTAEEILQSVPTVLEAAFLPPRKRASKTKHPRSSSVTNKIRQQEIEHVKKAVTLIKQNQHQFIESTDIVQATAIIEASLRQDESKKQALILVSHVHDADMVAAALSKIDPTLTVLDSRSTKPQRADIARAWRQGQIKTLVATRVGSILSPAPNLDTIFVVRSGSDEHAQYDRNPRYDARNLAWHWHQVTGARLAFFDVIPRVVDLDRFDKKLTTDNCKLTTDVINLKDEHQRSDVAILSEPLLEQISQTLQAGQKVILSYNYKAGVVPLQEHFPNARIARIEKDGNDTRKGVKADIILATQYYFENILNPFTEQNVGLVAELMADLSLSDSYYTATENTMRRLLELRGLAWRLKSNFVVQTWSPDLIKRMLDDPEVILEAETEVRKHFLYPPHGRTWRIFSRNDARKGVKQNDILTDVSPKIQDISPDIKISQTEHTLEIRSDLKYTKQINSLLKSLPDSYIIEVDHERNRQL